MTNTLSAVASKEFDSDVKQAFQSAGKLRMCTTIRNNVRGDTYNFRKIGKGLANQKATSDLVTPMDVQHELIPCTLNNWLAGDYTDIFDQAEVNFDERQELVQVIASALGRRFDQLTIDAFAAATPTIPDIVHGSAGLTLAKITSAATSLTDKGVPEGDRYIAISAAGLNDVLNDSTITSNDYNTVRALMAGTISSFMGFEWKVIESRDEGGLDLSGTTRTCLAWHKSAIGVAVGLDIRTEVNKIPERTSWLCNGVLKAGSVVRDTDGFVRIEITE